MTTPQIAVYAIGWGVGLLTLTVANITGGVEAAIMGATLMLSAELTALRQSRTP